MESIDSKEKFLASLPTKELFDIFIHPESSKEASYISKILKNRYVLNPYDVMVLKKPTDFITFDNSLLDQFSFLLGADPAKDDTDLKINVKRRNIKFNFNN